MNDTDRADEADQQKGPTQGEWYVRISRTDGLQIMAATDRVHLGGPKKGRDEHWPELLANVYLRSSRGERHANARVMAAAKDLLDAARLALTPDADPAAIKRALEKAVEKATVYRAVKEPEALRTKAEAEMDAMQDNWVSGD